MKYKDISYLLSLIWINSGIDICKMNFDGNLRSRVGVKGEGNNKKVKVVILEIRVWFSFAKVKRFDTEKRRKIRKMTCPLLSASLWFSSSVRREFWVAIHCLSLT